MTTAIALPAQAKLEGMKGKSFMFNTKVFKFNDFLQVSDRIIISTDSKAINLELSKVEKFIADCLPAEEPQSAVVAAAVIQPSVISELTAGLMSQFQKIRQADSDDQIKRSTAKAKAMVAISRGVTDIAKTALAVARQAKGE